MFFSPPILVLKGKRPGNIDIPVSGFSHFTEYPIPCKKTCFAPFRNPLSPNAFIFANSAISTLQKARMKLVKSVKTPNLPAFFPYLGEMKSRCFELLSFGAQPVCVLGSGSNLLLLARKAAPR